MKIDFTFTLRYSSILALFLACLFAGCEKPSLKTDSSSDTDSPAKSYAEIRKEIIGRKFQSLTLGSRLFSNAEVLRITDHHIEVKHANGTDEIPWGEVSEEVRTKWGFDPSAPKIVAKREPESKPAVAVEPTGIQPEVAAVTTPAPNVEPKKPKMTEQQKALEISRRQKMLEAQMAGIRQLESDLARRKLPLNELKRRLQIAKSKPRRSGVIVERMNSDSKLVDPRREARELEGKIKSEEKFVQQLEASLKAARTKYLQMKQSIDQLLIE